MNFKFAILLAILAYISDSYVFNATGYGSHSYIAIATDRHNPCHHHHCHPDSCIEIHVDIF